MHLIWGEVLELQGKNLKKVKRKDLILKFKNYYWKLKEQNKQLNHFKVKSYGLVFIKHLSILTHSLRCYYGSTSSTFT